MAIDAVKHIIAVASGKGGVGKSTTTVNLALAADSLGHRVGILDADIYGPSQAILLGQQGQRPEMLGDKRMKPVFGQGVYSMSMAYLFSDNTPMVWRGPMASGALQQMLTQTDWPELDLLFVDMPPGTGDIQLTLAQRAKVSGAVIVTTPQDLALIDARKAIEMFNKVNIPVLGIVENMAIHMCSQCGHEEAIFGTAGGDLIADEYRIQLLGRLPLAMAIREQADGGKPSVIADPESDHSQAYLAIAEQLIARLANNSEQPVPVISVTDD